MTLLVFGIVGGWVGAPVAQQLFRHKTQKQPFRTWFMLSVVLNVLVVVLGILAGTDFASPHEDCSARYSA
jgi:uncharacterized membrane protein YsdA (DUF1294 family)